MQALADLLHETKRLVALTSHTDAELSKTLRYSLQNPPDTHPESQLSPLSNPIKSSSKSSGKIPWKTGPSHPEPKPQQARHISSCAHCLCLVLIDIRHPAAAHRLASLFLQLILLAIRLFQTSRSLALGNSTLHRILCVPASASRFVPGLFFSARDNDIHPLKSFLHPVWHKEEEPRTTKSPPRRPGNLPRLKPAQVPIAPRCQYDDKWHRADKSSTSY